MKSRAIAMFVAGVLVLVLIVAKISRRIAISGFEVEVCASRVAIIDLATTIADEEVSDAARRVAINATRVKNAGAEVSVFAEIVAANVLAIAISESEVFVFAVIVGLRALATITLVFCVDEAAVNSATMLRKTARSESAVDADAALSDAMNLIIAKIVELGVTDEKSIDADIGRATAKF